MWYIFFRKSPLFCTKYTTGHVHTTRLHFRSEINESHHAADDDQSTTTAHLLTYRIYRSPYGGVGTYPPHRSASRANNNNNNNNQQNVPEESNALRFAAAGGATLSRLHMMQQTQGPQAQEAIKRQTMSARGLSDKEFTKHCRGFDVQIKVCILLLCVFKKVVYNSAFPSFSYYNGNQGWSW